MTSRPSLPLLFVLAGCSVRTEPAVEVRFDGPDALVSDVACRRAEAAVQDSLRAVHAAATPRVELAVAPRVPGLAPDGFVLRAASAPLSMSVRANDVRGVVYGLHELARLIRLRRWAPGADLDRRCEPAFDTRLCGLHDNPGERPFETRFRDPEVLLDLGFNGILIHGLAGLCTYDRYDAELVPEGGPERDEVLAARSRVRELVERAKRNHLLVFLDGDEVAVPLRALEIYREEVLADPGPDGERLVSSSKPRVHDIVRATFEELHALFPDVDGYQVRTGEVYTESEPMLAGNSPVNAWDASCAGWSREDKVRALQRTIADVVCREHGKRLNLRMWGYYDSAHSVPERWCEFSDPIEPSALETFSFKHPKTDYWRWNQVNPNFGLGAHAQWAEFQMAREYEGKGAFPSYLGRYLAEGPTECRPSGGLAALHAKGVRGAWCWARGGGYRGPFPASEDWIALNVYAFARLLWDPSEDPWRLAADWGTLELGLEPRSRALERFVEVQRLSEEAVLASRYLGVLIRGQHFRSGTGWTPDGNWSRDDKIGVRKRTPPARTLYRFLRSDGTVAAALEERRRALDLWSALASEFEQLVQEAGGGERLQGLFHTALYGKSLFDTTNHAFLAGWTACLWEDGGRVDPGLARLAREELTAARGSWKDYRERVCKLPGVATPYEELGFSEEWDGIEALLGPSR